MSSPCDGSKKHEIESQHTLTEQSWKANERNSKCPIFIIITSKTNFIVLIYITALMMAGSWD